MTSQKFRLAFITLPKEESKEFSVINIFSGRRIQLRENFSSVHCDNSGKWFSEIWQRWFKFLLKINFELG